MTASKTSARTNADAKPSLIPSGRNGSGPAIEATKPTGPSRGRSSNGTQPTSTCAKPTTSPSAAPAFPLRTSLREFMADNPSLKTRDEIATAYVAKVDESELRNVLRAAVRSHIYTAVNSIGSSAWRHAGRSDGQVAPSNGSAKWDEIGAAQEDGSLDRYREIVDREFFVNETRVRFGSMTLPGIEALADLRGHQEQAIKRQREQLLRVREQMQATGAKTVDDLDRDWLVEWNAHA